MFNIDGIKYKKMPYVVSYRDGDDIILFNMVTRKLMVTNAHRYKSPDETLLSELAEKQFILPEDTDPEKWIDEVKALNAARKDRISRYTIMTTTDCNAACPYCYEAGRGRIHMTDKTAEDVADYILKTSEDREASIMWFGGEPLCNKSAADIISKKLRDAGKKFSSIIVSNGYLFDEETVRIAKNHWMLEKAQITLDGTEEAFNRTKAFVNAGGSPYRRVLNNIELLARNGIFVKIRLNVTKYNAEDLKKLSIELGARFKGTANICVYPSPVLSYSDFDDGGFTEEERFTALDTVHEIEKVLENCGLYKTDLPDAALSPFGCMAENPDAVVINPLGRLGKCDHHSEEEQFGSIYSEEYDEDLLNSWRKTYPDIEECRECFFRPECRRPVKCPLCFSECVQKDRDYLYRECVREVMALYEKMKLVGKYKTENIKLAGHVFRVEYRYEYFSEHCSEFFVDKASDGDIKGTADAVIRITDEDIDAEEKISDVDMSRGYYEALAVYRKICEYLIDHNIVLFHGSAIMAGDGAFIFTVPSGTGKSTHARLWREYLGDRVTMINDDKPLVEFADAEVPRPVFPEEEIIVHGTPYSGKSHLHTNISAPLKAIVVLRKAEENRIRRLSGREIFIHLYPQMYRPKMQDKTEKVLDMLNRLGKIPVYLLECTPSKEAVELAWETLKGTGCMTSTH